MHSNSTKDSTAAVCGSNAYLLPLQLGQNDFDIEISPPEALEQVTSPQLGAQIHASLLPHASARPHAGIQTPCMTSLHPDSTGLAQSLPDSFNPETAKIRISQIVNCFLTL